MICMVKKRDLNRPVHTAAFKVDNQQGSTVVHRERCQTLCNNLNGKRI